MKRLLVLWLFGSTLVSGAASADQARVAVATAEVRDLGAKGLGILVELDLPDLQGYAVERGVLAVANAGGGTRGPVEIWAVGARADREPAFEATGRTQVSFGSDEITCDITNLLHCVADGADVDAVWLVRPQSVVGSLDAESAQRIASAFEEATLRIDLHRPFQRIGRPD
jgi:hypothetical protein